jgi:hypothetical protein
MSSKSALEKLNDAVYALSDRYADATNTNKRMLRTALLDDQCGGLWYNKTDGVQQFNAIPVEILEGATARANTLRALTNPAAAVVSINEMMARSAGWRESIRRTRRANKGKTSDQIDDERAYYKKRTLMDQAYAYAKRAALRLTDSNSLDLLEDVIPASKARGGVRPSEQLLRLVFDLATGTCPWWEFDAHVKRERKFANLPTPVVRDAHKMLLDICTCPDNTLRDTVTTFVNDWRELPHRAPPPVSNQPQTCETPSDNNSTALFSQAAQSAKSALHGHRPIKEIMDDVLRARASLFALMASYANVCLKNQTTPYLAQVEAIAADMKSLASFENEWSAALVAQAND